MRPTALVFITDGRRQYAERTLASLRAHSIDLPSGFNRRFVQSICVDDSCDPAYSAWLDEQWPWTHHLPTGRRKRGFDGAIRAGWEAVQHGIEYVFHLEDDFEFERELPLASMQWILQHQPHVVQVALKRQPWSDEEIREGGIVQVNPDAFEQKIGQTGFGWPEWYEHRLFFTTNPSLYRRSLLDRGWPVGEHSEGRFTLELLGDDPEATFAYIGKKYDEPWVTHIGGEVPGVSLRAGTNY